MCFPVTIETGERIIGRYTGQFGAGTDLDLGKGRTALQKDLARISETQLQIENNSIKEAQKGLDEQKRRYQQIERETAQLRKTGAISKAEANERKGIVKDLKAQRKAQRSAFDKQFQKRLYSPGLQNAAFTAPFVLSMAQGVVPEGRGGTGQGITQGAFSGAAAGGANGS